MLNGSRGRNVVADKRRGICPHASVSLLCLPSPIRRLCPFADSAEYEFALWPRGYSGIQLRDPIKTDEAGRRRPFFTGHSAPQFPCQQFGHRLFATSGTRTPSVIINTPNALPRRQQLTAQHELQPHSQGPHHDCEHQCDFDTVSHSTAAVASFRVPRAPPRPQFRPISRPCQPASLILYCLQPGYHSSWSASHRWTFKQSS